jgi:hypothetical protein
VSLLAERVGLRVTHLVNDSTVLQIWASEQYRQNVPLNDPRTAEYEWSDRRRDWERLVRRLNRRGDGDHATFVLQYVDLPKHPSRSM